MESETSELPTPLSMTWKVSIEPLTFSSAYPVQRHQELELKRIQADFRVASQSPGKYGDQSLSERRILWTAGSNSGAH